MLQVENLVVKYGNIAAVKGISLDVAEGEIISVVGANGAGKSTTVNTIAGIVKMTSGKIIYNGIDISKTTPQERVKQGIILAPEGRQMFNEMSVKENLLMGAYLQDSASANQMFDTIFDLFPILKSRLKQPAGTLSGGEQQMLCIGRAMMSKPKLLMLDEPSLGLAPLIVKEIFELIKRIREMGCTILLIEQNVRMALGVSDRAYVMQTGEVVISGNSKDVVNMPEVQEAYLGGK
jgi:branched-chain amino acid transport system ATP-binding protein